MNKKISIILCSLALFGCNNDSDVVVEPTPIPHTSINGLASQGGAIKGLVTFNQSQDVSLPSEKSASGFSVRSASALSVADSSSLKALDGVFTLDNTDKLNYPVLLKIEGTHGISSSTEYTLLLDNNSDRINISPLTRLIVSKVTGVDAGKVFNDLPTYQSLLTKENIDKAQAELLSVIAPLLEAAGLDQEIDLFTAVYDPNFKDLDSVLSTLDVDYAENKATITYIPSSDYKVELPYASDWQGKELIPDNSDKDKLAQELTIIYQANDVLEAMVLLKDDKNKFDQYLAPTAHWFGSGYATLHDTYFNIQPNEKDPNFNRYRDFVILETKSDENRYLLGYTTAFEASNTVSIARDQAWFELNASGELKFLGEDQPYPVSVYALYKLNSAPAKYNWVNSEAFSWSFETTGFLSSQQCVSGFDRGNWDNAPAFYERLPSVGELDSGLLYITVTTEGNSQINDHGIKLDKIYRDANDGACYLVDSVNTTNSVFGAYEITIHDEGSGQEHLNIKDNAAYTVTYTYSDTSKNISKKIYLTQAPQRKSEMEEYLANLKSIDGQEGQFSYDWTRSNPFVVEGDLYVHLAGEDASHRVQIQDGKTEATATGDELPGDAKWVFHNAFDPYGRIIMNYYVTADGSPLK